jgi:DNA invertase Pin-like site-specific DNA recombinase
LEKAWNTQHKSIFDERIKQHDKRVAIYARSATSQKKEKSALESQIEQCRTYSQEHGYTVDEQYISSEVSSGKADHHQRPQLGEILRLVAEAAPEQRPFDTLLVCSVDRLSRDWAQATAIIEELRRHGITVECVDRAPLERAERQGIMSRSNAGGKQRRRSNSGSSQ